MWGAYVYAELREKGDLVLPVAMIPHRISLGDKVGFLPSFALGVLTCAVLGLLAHVLVFRPLRAAPVLAKVVASVGILLFLQALAALQFGSASRILSPIFGRKTFDIGGTEFPRDRIWLAVCAIGVAIVLAAYFRWARYGLATSAAAENERATALAGYSPQLLAGSTWILASVVAGGLGILVSPATPLTPGTYSLAIIPALAAALIGRLRSIPITAAAGLCLGAFQSVVTFQTGKPWWPKWAITGLSDAVPFILIIVGLFLWGDRLPTRGELQAPRLPAVPRQAPSGQRGGACDGSRRSGDPRHLGWLPVRSHHQHGDDRHHAVIRDPHGIRRTDLPRPGGDRRCWRFCALEDHGRSRSPVSVVTGDVQPRSCRVRGRDRHSRTASSWCQSRSGDLGGCRRTRAVRVPQPRAHETGGEPDQEAGVLWSEPRHPKRTKRRPMAIWVGRARRSGARGAGRWQPGTKRFRSEVPRNTVQRTRCRGRGRRRRREQACCVRDVVVSRGTRRVAHRLQPRTTLGGELHGRGRVGLLGLRLLGRHHVCERSDRRRNVGTPRNRIRRARSLAQSREQLRRDCRAQSDCHRSDEPGRNRRSDPQVPSESRHAGFRRGHRRRRFGGNTDRVTRLDRSD